MASSDAETQNHLSTRQLAVLQCTAQGFSTDEVAARLGLKPDQVRQTLLAILRQLGARTKLEAILRAVQLGLLDLELQADDPR